MRPAAPRSELPPSRRCRRNIFFFLPTYFDKYLYHLIFIFEYDLPHSRHDDR